MRPCVLSAMFVCCFAQATPRATIELRAQASVSAEQVTLGDVAILRSADLEVVRKLVNLPIGDAPRVGQSAVVHRAALEAWVRGQVEIAQDALAWRGPAETRVARASREVRGEELAAAAAEALRAALAMRGVAADVHVPHLPRDVRVPAGAVRLEARARDQAPLGPRMLVWVDIWVGEALLRTVPVALTAAWNEPPLYSAIRLHAAAASDSARRNGGLAPGDGRLVQRGEWAALRAVAGAVVLESRVEVLQDGHRGQRVRVRQPGATGLVFARVVAPGALELAP